MRVDDEMRPEYDLRGGVRGKYYQQYREGTNIALLDSDVAAVFHGSESVNQALRVLIKAASSKWPPHRRSSEPNNGLA
ncbi:MAG: hypothetical protein ACLQVL_33400 [Terriglobia bacterium]